MYGMPHLLPLRASLQLMIAPLCPPPGFVQGGGGVPPRPP
eukprot:COSAG01_NODE_80532_length_119_cov_38.350000_1_plen_39_part_11